LCSMPALINDLAVGVAVPEAGGVMSFALMLAVCDEFSVGVLSRTIESGKSQYEFHLG
jgi:hypothetical protein